MLLMLTLLLVGIMVNIGVLCSACGNDCVLRARLCENVMPDARWMTVEYVGNDVALDFYQ